jgi:chaperonin GroES
VWIRAAIPGVRAPQWSRTEIKIDGEELSIIKESDIMGIIESKRAASKAA